MPISEYADEWHHYTITRDQATGDIKLYIDGKDQNLPLKVYPDDPGNNFQSSGKIMIGQLKNNTQFFKGSLKNLVLYKSLKSVNEIKQSASKLNESFPKDAVLYIPMNTYDKNIYYKKSASNFLMADNGNAVDSDYFWCPSNDMNLAVTYPGGYQAIKSRANVQQRFRIKKCKPGRNPLAGANSWVPTSASDEERIIRGGDIIAIYSPQNNKVYDCAWGPASPCSHQPFPPPGGNWGTPMKIFIESGSVGEKINLSFVVYFTRMLQARWNNSKSIMCNNSECKGVSIDNKSTFKFKLVENKTEKIDFKNMGSGICAPWRGVNLGNNRWRCSNNDSYPGGIRDNGENYTKKSPEECKTTCQNMSNCKFYSVGKGNCMLFSSCAGPSTQDCTMSNGYTGYNSYKKN